MTKRKLDNAAKTAKRRGGADGILAAVKKHGTITWQTLEYLTGALTEAKMEHHFEVAVRSGALLKIIDNERDAKETIKRLRAAHAKREAEVEALFKPGVRVEKTAPWGPYDRIKKGTRGTVSDTFNLPPNEAESGRMSMKGRVWVVWDNDRPDPEGAGGDRCFMEPDRMKVIG